MASPVVGPIIKVIGIAGPGDPLANPRESLETFRLVRKRHPDLILCDLEMPRMDGLSLLQKLQETEGTPSTIIVSAYGDMANIRTAMKLSVIEADAQMHGQSMDKLVADSHLGEPEGIAKILAWLVSDDADYLRGFVFTR